MIQNNTGYNPFPAIMKAKPSDGLYTNEFLDFVQQELFKAGIVAENSDEMDSVLNILVEMEII